MRILLTREETVISVPSRFFYFGNMCQCGMCHTMVVFVSVISVLTRIALKTR